MEIDPRTLPSPEATIDISKEVIVPKAGDDTSKNEAQEETLIELESLKTKNLELQKQKEHWREKYERDITNKPTAEIADDFLSDEGKVLKEQINKLNEKLASRDKQDEESRIFTTYPQLKDKRDEFQEFLDDPDNAGIKLEKVAKLFLVEKGLLETPPKRIGLERGTGGSKITSSSTLPTEDIKRLRENNPRRYQQMLRSGKIDPSKIV
jgi:preprotein translocase subunit SecD